MSGQTIWIVAMAAVAMSFGLRWWQLNRRLANAVFGQDAKLAYVHQRWVLSGTIDGLQARYTTGAAGGWFPGLSYLWIPMPVSRPGHITPESMLTEAQLPPAALLALRDLDGFRRLDMIGDGVATASTLGRISWLAAGEGLLLCCYTKRGGDADAVKRNAALLAEFGEHVR